MRISKRFRQFTSTMSVAAAVKVRCQWLLTWSGGGWWSAAAVTAAAERQPDHERAGHKRFARSTGNRRIQHALHPFYTRRHRTLENHPAACPALVHSAHDFATAAVYTSCKHTIKQWVRRPTTCAVAVVDPACKRRSAGPTELVQPHAPSNHRRSRPELSHRPADQRSRLSRFVRPPPPWPDRCHCFSCCCVWSHFGPRRSRCTVRMPTLWPAAFSQVSRRHWS